MLALVQNARIRAEETAEAEAVLAEKLDEKAKLEGKATEGKAGKEESKKPEPAKAEAKKDK